MLIRRSQKKRNAEPAQKQNHRRLVIDPMVNPGSSAHRHQARPKADPTRPHHRMVTLAQSSPGDRPALAHQSKTTTVMLGLGYTGLQTVSAGLGGLIVSANPVFTAGLAALFLGESLTWRKVAGLLLGIAGVSFIVWHRMSVGTDSWHGIVFTLASLASIVAGTILFKLFAPKGSLWIGNGVQNLAAGVVLLPFAFTLADVGDIVPSTRLLGAFAFLTLGGSILA